jgi:hypothetical protein
MGKIGKSAGREQRAQEQLKLSLRELVREALSTRWCFRVWSYVGEVLEGESTALCGLRYQHEPLQSCSSTIPAWERCSGQTHRALSPAIRSQ